MSHIRLTILLVSLLGPAVAHAADGGVHLYFQPLPPQAARLTFSLSAVSVVAANGSERPLTVGLRRIGQTEASRQRLLASGRLPSGAYAGFLLRLARPALKGSRGDVTLAVPEPAEAPVRVDFPFVISERRSSVVWLSLNYEQSLKNGIEFSPVFSAVAPTKPIAEHTGFVTNSGSDSITVFDKSLGQVVAITDTCAGPAGMALDRQRSRVYVACPDDEEIQSLDLTTGEVLERSRLSPGDRPRELALTPDGLTVIAVNSGSHSISFFSAASLARQERLTVGSGPASLLVDPTGRRAFVFNTLSSDMSVVDIASRTVIASVSTEAAPLRGQFSRRGDRLYVIHERSPYLTVLDPMQLSIVTRARLRNGIAAIAVDTVRDLLCVGGPNDTEVEFYDPTALMPLYILRTRAGVSYLAIDAGESTLYLVSPETRTVVVASLSSRKILSEIDVGVDPAFVLVMGGW